MNIERTDFMEVLKDSYSAYYTIADPETEELPLVFRGDYFKRDMHYWFTKKAVVWDNQTGEFAYAFSAESFTPELAERCIDYALEDGLPRVQPGKDHYHTDIKVLLIADTVSEETKKLVQKKSFTKNYNHSLWGFTNLLVAAVDLSGKKTYTNKAGNALVKYFRKLFDARK